MITILEVKELSEGAILAEYLTSYTAMMLSEEKVEFFETCGTMGSTHIGNPVLLVFDYESLEVTCILILLSRIPIFTHLKTIRLNQILQNDPLGKSKYAC